MNSTNTTSLFPQIDAMAAEFSQRHIGPNEQDITSMLRSLSVEDLGAPSSLDELIAQTVPAQIRTAKPLALPQALTENAVLGRAREYATENKIYKSMIGQGYYGTITPPVVLRNILENPGWYTAYTPYQAEISQGRLEALLNFQTLITDLTALPIANASLLDEGTAAAEAMNLCFHDAPNAKKKAKIFLVSDRCHPQTIEVLCRRAAPLGITPIVAPVAKWQLGENVFGCLLQYPDTAGEVAFTLTELRGLTDKIHQCGALAVVAADPLALTLLAAPGEWGADIAIGSTQRFGVPMGFGGPHAAYFAVREEFKRSIPGRLVGVSVDAKGKPALRLALQTREQHIRREKATSNICTAQVLLAVMASMYAVYHGPKGLKAIAQRIQTLTTSLAEALKRAGLNLIADPAFDTLVVLASQKEQLKHWQSNAAKVKINLREYREDDTLLGVGLSLDENTTLDDVQKVLEIFGASSQSLKLEKVATTSLTRQSEFLKNRVFSNYHSETELLRYLHRLQAMDLSLTHSMIPLGSCTMKLNATAEMIPVTWPEFGNLHPFAPADQTVGIRKMISELENWLCEITGFAGVSLQPNAGSAGEYAGLLAIRDYHFARGEKSRNVCLIPSSAHGTNPASAAMAGMKVVVVACDSQGNIDIADLTQKAKTHSSELAALMVTYPSTHGVFEEGIREICEVIHQNGGQVYMDGANFNALVGLCRPGEFGPDVCHLNLHKTFCIPHGGGGPGVGPIGVKAHLKPYLPSHHLSNGTLSDRKDNSAVASAPFGSASIHIISWSYIAMMGQVGLTQATKVAILNANYIASRLSSSYPILYRGRHGRVAHECILDLRNFKKVAVEDVAKRLMDYGFHAPTMSWPVIGTLMVEPTESESKQELDRFCDAMIAIRAEIAKVESGEWNEIDNPLKNAPHTVEEVTTEEWQHPYSRATAAFPLNWVRTNKFWPKVARINNPYGDRNLVCSCAPLEEYENQNS